MRLLFDVLLLLVLAARAQIPLLENVSKPTVPKRIDIQPISPPLPIFARQPFVKDQHHSGSHVDCEVHKVHMLLTNTDGDDFYRCILLETQLAYNFPDWFVDDYQTELERSNNVIVRIHGAQAPADTTAEMLEIPRHASV